MYINLNSELHTLSKSVQNLNHLISYIVCEYRIAIIELYKHLTVEANTKTIEKHYLIGRYKQSKVYLEFIETLLNIKLFDLAHDYKLWDLDKVEFIEKELKEMN